MKTLVIAEKPSVGKDIARVLNCRGGGNGAIEGNNYIVTWALGHLVTLADPEVYGEKYKTWQLDHLPIIPEKPQLVVIKQTGKQYKTVKDLINRNDVKEIIIATDAGREGELVARWILEKAKSKKPVKRLWISSVTDKAIREGFQKLRDGKEYLNLYNSAQARAEADWLVGINATRALTTKHNAQLSCGRVQTPTLAIVQKKEEEIRNFKPQDYYKTTFKSGNVTFTWLDGKGNVRQFDKEKADVVFNSVKNQKATVSEVNKSMKKNFAPGLYDLTTLQRDANRIFGYSAKETLSLMQNLYERHKVLTYPRTDSKFISKDILETIPDRLKAVRFGNYKSFAAQIMNGGIKGNPSFVDDKKVSDHHAIIPTEQPADPSDFTDREFKIFDLVVKRFLAVFLPPFEYEQTVVKVKIQDQYFTARGKRVINAGYRQLYGLNDSEEDGEQADLKEQLLPQYEKGAVLDTHSFKQVKEQTKPPASFTEGTLLAAMENPAPYMEQKDKMLAKTLGETGGLGTVATRADIIEKLFSSAMLEKRGNSIFITSKGRQLLKLAPDGLRSPDLTAEWEQKLTKIAQGSLSKNQFLAEIKEYTIQVIGEIKGSQAIYRHDNITGRKCPECGKYLLEINGKRGKTLVCQDPECRYKKQVSINTNARCPQCHKKLQLVGEGDQQRFVCACGYKEKMEAFEKRKAQERNQPSKRDVQKYLNQINQEEKPVNSAIADALAQLKLDK